METWIAKEEIHKGKIFSLWGGKVALDNGKLAVREYVRHPGGVAIVPVLDNHVLLVRQFRIAIERELIELPAGLLEAGEQPIDCAARELEEELGYRASELVPLAACYSSVGFANERIHIFLARGLEKTKLNPDAEERIGEVRLSLDEIRSRLDAQDFEDAKTIIGLRETLAYLARQLSS